MANGPGDYRDPKVTTTGQSGSMRWLWYLLGALLLLLLLGWLLGLFGREAAEEAQTEGAATETVTTEGAATETTTETVTTEEPATETTTTEEPAATEGAAEPVETESGEAVVTEDGEPVVTEEATE